MEVKLHAMPFRKYVRKTDIQENKIDIRIWYA